MNKPVRNALIIVSASILLGAVGGWFARRTDSPLGPMPRLVLAAEPVPSSSPVWIAEHNGYFRDEGVLVEIREFESGRTALFTMLDQGGIDLATAAQTPVVAKSFGRNDYAIVANMMSSDQDVKLIARRDRGIASAQDLRAKTVGVTSGSSGHFFLNLFLAYHQLQSADVKLCDLEPAQLGRALIAGEVDAVATWEPHIYRTRKALGENAVLLPSRNIYREDFYFVARKELIHTQGEGLKRFLRAIERAHRFMRNDDRAARDIVQRRLKIDQEIIEATWEQFHFTLNLDQSILVALEDEARWAMENNQTDVPRMPNYLEYIHSDALLAVRPEAVTIAGRKR